MTSTGLRTADRTEDRVGWIRAGAPATLVFAACFLGGANEAFSALALSAISGALLLALVLHSSAATRLQRIESFGTVAVAFCLVLLVALWSLTPWLPGGRNPAWDYSRGLGASSIDRSRTLIEIFKLMSLACLFCLGAFLGLSDEDARRARLCALALGGAFCLWSIAELAGPGRVWGLRLTGGLPSPNVAGTLIASVALLTLPLLARPSRIGGASAATGAVHWFAARSVPLSLLLAFCACLVLTASRGALLSAAAAAAAFLGLQLASGRIKLSRALTAAAVAMAAGAAVLLAKGQLAIERFGRIAPGDAGRATIAAYHWETFLRSPLFGYGLGSFDSANKLGLNRQTYPALWSIRSAHNVYLQWLEGAGLVGAAPMFACLAVALAATLRNSSRRRRSRTWIHGLLAVDVLFLAHGASDFALEVPGIAAFWALVLGLQLGMTSASGGEAASA